LLWRTLEEFLICFVKESNVLIWIVVRIEGWANKTFVAIGVFWKFFWIFSINRLIQNFFSNLRFFLSSKLLFFLRRKNQIEINRITNNINRLLRQILRLSQLVIPQRLRLDFGFNGIRICFIFSILNLHYVFPFCLLN